MRKQIIAIFSLVVIVSVLFAGCSKNISTTETVKPTDNSQGNKLIGQYNELVKNNATPKQILDFARTNLGKMDKSDADTVLEGYIGALTGKLEGYDYGEGFGTSLKEYKDLKDLQDSLGSSSGIKEETKNRLLDAYGEGYKLHRLEDGYNLAVNYELIKTEFSKNVSEKFADYISIMAETVNGKDTTLFEMPKDLEAITSELIKIENYRNKYKITDEPKGLTQVYNDYKSVYLVGGKYSYTRDMETNVLKPEVLKIYKENQEKYKGSNLEKITTQLIKILEKNKYKFTDEVFDKIRNL